MKLPFNLYTTTFFATIALLCGCATSGPTAATATGYGTLDKAAAGTEAADSTSASTSTDAAPTWRERARPVAGCAADEKAFDCDRRAILSMLGDYKVSFAFDETVELAAGYQRQAPHRSGGFETVVLVADEGTRIELQHLLVGPDDHVTKHWRQEWLYEARSGWTYSGDQRFAAREREASEVAGTWTQRVYEVSDVPRYAGGGRWNHRYGVSTWTSERTWRPLPRREYTKRSDYQLLNVENRHTITPSGWTHEQDNTKVVRDGQGRDTTLVREFGFNDYRRIDGFDFSPAYRYWQQTAPYWSKVRATIAERLRGGLQLRYPIGDEALIFAILGEAEAFREHANLEQSSTIVDEAFDTHTGPINAQAAQR